MKENHIMENETQNQDTQAAPQQQPVVEEAQAAPEQAMDATQATTSEVVHDDPGNIPEGAYDPRSNPDLSPDDGILPDGEPYVPEGGYDLDFIPIDPSYDSTNDLFRTPEDTPWDDPSDTEVVSEDSNQGGYDGSGIAGGLGLDENGMPENTGINPHVQSDFPANDPAGQAEPPDSEAVAPLSPEAVSMPTDKIVDPVPSDQAGEWISGFNGDFWLDASGRMWDSPEQAASASPEEVEARPPTFEEFQGYLGSSDKGATEDENPDLTGADPEEAKDATGGDPEEDPKDRGEGVMEDDGEGGINPADADYQEVLDDLDNGNLDDVREFLESLGHSDDDTEVAPKDAPGVPDEDGKLVDEGISIEDIVGGEENVQEGLEDVNNNSTEEYTYDEEAYEDAEHAMKDLQHALKHGDEEERAEALEKLQGYLGGFDKGAEEKTQDGSETQDDQIPSDSANDSDGDPEEVPNTVDKEPVDAPDASGAAVSGPAVGAAGAAVDEAKGLDQDGTETQDNQILSGSDYYDGAFGTMGDTDGDGVLNWEDSDWDTFDRDGDGKEDYLVLDADDDGIVDVKEDADGDGIVDVQDVDADNDGTDDWLVSDFDGDGIEYGKEDDDSDGIENAKDDSDGDGMLDWKDSDSDGNGIDDWVEIFSDPYEFDCFPGEDSYDYNAW
jgi:hypothetical protein